MSSENDVIVWEWFDEYHRWRSYPAEVSNKLELTHREGGSHMNLGTVDPRMQCYDIDFIQNVQKRKYTGTERSVRRQIYPENGAVASNCFWQWEGDVPGSFHQYDFEVTEILEAHYCAYKHHHSKKQKKLDLSKQPCRLPYVIDFKRMTQTRIETQRPRRIERIPKATPQLYMRVKDTATTLPGGTAVHLSRSKSAGAAAWATVPNLGSDGSSSFPNTGHSGIGGTTTGGVVGSPFGHYHNSMPSSIGSSRASSFGGVASFVHSLPGPGTGGAIMLSTDTAGSGGQTNMPPATGGNPMFGGAAAIGNAPPMPVRSTTSMRGAPNTTTFGQTTMSHIGSSRPVTRSATRQMGGLASATVTGLHHPSTTTAVPYHQGLPTVVTGLPHTTTTHYQGPPTVSVPPGWHPPMALPGGIAVSSVGVGATRAMTTRQKKKVKRVRPQLPAMGSYYNVGPGEVGGARGGAIPKKPKKGKQDPEQSFNHVVHRYTSTIKDPPKDEDCCICMTELTETSGHNDQCSQIVKLQCTHMLHKSCLKAMYESGTQDGSLQCPTCKSIFGVKFGNCPAGQMTYNRTPNPIPGYPDCGLIQIHYNIQAGVQGKEHPNPGERYVCQGFPRVGYLPDNEDGQQILRLLIKAWQRRLTFTIGTSVTTGLQNAVVWNEIHHKTEVFDQSGHGYPDPNYFSNVRMEMASQGVVDSEEEREEEEVEGIEEGEDSDDDL